MNYYIQEFVKGVLSLVNNPRTKEAILSGKMSIESFLEENAYKGINPQIVLKCLEIRDLNYLNDLACRQNRINAYYDEWIECFIRKQGPTYMQNRINEELKHDNIIFIDENGESYSVTKRLVLSKNKK